MYRAAMYAWRRGRSVVAGTGTWVREARGAAWVALLAVAHAVGCSTPQPKAPYVSEINTAVLTAELRSDTPIDDDERALCDAVRAAEAAMQEWYDAPPRTTVRVWMLTPERHARYVRSVDSDPNIGALTRVGRRVSDIYVSVPATTETDEGNRLEVQLCQFQVAHELVHAWLGRSASSDADESLANFIAQRAMDSLGATTGGDRSVPANSAALTGPYDAMQAYCRFLERDRKQPISVDMMARAEGDEAYILPWLLLEYASQELSRAQFRVFSRWLMTSASPSLVERRLRKELATVRKQEGKELDIAAEIAAFTAGDRDRTGRWCAPPGFIGVGRRPDGTAVLLGKKSIVFAALTSDDCLDEDSRELDRRLGGPALVRCAALRLRREHGELPWAALADGALLLGEPIPETPVHSAPDGKRLASATVPAGEWLTLAVESPDLVLRCHRGTELARWRGKACSVVRVSYRQRRPDGALGVLEITPTYSGSVEVQTTSHTP
jgi:hypothetical protein